MRHIACSVHRRDTVHCPDVQALGAPGLLLGHQLVCLEGKQCSPPVDIMPLPMS